MSDESIQKRTLGDIMLAQVNGEEKGNVVLTVLPGTYETSKEAVEGAKREMSVDILQQGGKASPRPYAIIRMVRRFTARPVVRVEIGDEEEAPESPSST